MVLKQAFNALTRLHSRPATLKRLGTPDIFSPVRITQSNYSRYLEGPSHMTIRGREFIMPVDTMTGHKTQIITFSGVPTVGSFLLKYNGADSAAILHNNTFAEVQTALRAVAGLSNVLVTGSFSAGFLVNFVGIQDPLAITSVAQVPALDKTISVANSKGVLWSPVIKRGDKIVDQIYGSLAIDEVTEIIDIGGTIMGYRCRSE